MNERTEQGKKEEKKILVFAGTTEGRILSGRLSACGVPHTVCVATEYGEELLEENPLVRVHQGRMDADAIRTFLLEEGFGAVVDATHPYARTVTENIRRAAEETGVLLLRLKRAEDTDAGKGNRKMRSFPSHEACASALQEQEGNILLTTGSRELAAYCADEGVRKRLYVRVLPGLESISACIQNGVEEKRILALQGPFGAEMNEALIRQYRISCLVTKDSGRAGGFGEKLEAAEKTGIPVFVIGRPPEREGLSFREVWRRLEDFLQKKLSVPAGLEILLAGAGMGSREGMTGEAAEAAESADILFGPSRLTAPYAPPFGKHPFYRADQIIPCLKKLLEEGLFLQEARAVVLFSGDSGFYSGCGALYRALEDEIASGRLAARVRILPGISSVSALAAYAGVGYEDAAVLSMHGRELPNLARRVALRKKTFLLTSGVKDVNRLGRALMAAGLSECRVTAGRSLASPEQALLSLTPQECAALKEEGLYTCLIQNPAPREENASCGLSDSAFLRDRVPMTKEEIRHVSVSKLHLSRNAVVYDIGSGTGSVAVEMASLSDDIRVLAIERKEEAAELIEKNAEKFGLENIAVIRGSAPEVLSGLPRATHAFIGGSGGRLEEILSALYEENPDMRVVINAVSLETICRMKEILSGWPVKNRELVQVQTARAVRAGDSLLMKAENPVWICVFDFTQRERTGEKE